HQLRRHRPLRLDSPPRRPHLPLRHPSPLGSSRSGRIIVGFASRGGEPVDLRPSPIAGQWYAGDARTLGAEVDSYLAAAGAVKADGDIVALIAPHAGYRYSGAVAGHAFAAARVIAPEVVAVVGPMHYPLEGPGLISGHSAYQTRLGRVMIGREACRVLDDALRQELGAGLTPVKGDPEHSIEIELPFLQRVLPGEWRLLPVMVRDQRREVAR